jgi:hypothetical protein
MGSVQRVFFSAAGTVGTHPGPGVGTGSIVPDTVSDRGPVGAGIRHALYQASTVVVFAVLPVALTLTLLGANVAKKPFLYDFNGGLYQAGRAIVGGQSPYRADFVERRAALMRLSDRPDLAVISVPVYPPPVLLAAVPFSSLPYPVAGVLFMLLSIAGLIAGLYLLGVRDWRCFGVAFLSWPVLHGAILGAVTPLLVLGVGLAWHWRARVTAPALSVAAVITAKLFPWTLGVWLLATRRLRTAALAAALVIVGTVSAWALIGFAGMSSYPHMLASLDSLSAGAGVSLVAALLALGVGATIAQLLALAVAVTLLGAAWSLYRRPDGDRLAMGLAVVAALIASPMVWPHYFALAFVPIALLSPRLSPLWFVPLLTWLAPVAQSTGHAQAILPYLAISVLLAVRLCVAPRIGGKRRAVGRP